MCQFFTSVKKLGSLEVYKKFVSKQANEVEVKTFLTTLNLKNEKDFYDQKQIRNNQRKVLADRYQEIFTDKKNKNIIEQACLKVSKNLDFKTKYKGEALCWIFFLGITEYCLIQCNYEMGSSCFYDCEMFGLTEYFLCELLAN